MPPLSKLTVFFLFLGLSINLFAQDDNLRSQSINIYIDCEDCDMDYIRQEVSFVNYVREPKEADLHILVTSQTTGAGGKKTSLYFIGQKEYKDKNDTLIFNCSPDDTDDIQREEFVKTLKVGLIQFVQNTPIAQKIEINYSKTEQEEEVIDKWNGWVFSVELAGYINADNNYSNFQLNTVATADKITEKFKTETYLSYYYSESNYDYIDYSFNSVNTSKYAGNMTVFSLNDHWSAGISTELRSSSYSNLNFRASVLPAIEYNLFTYDESTRKQVRIGYFIGPEQNYYVDTTIYNKMDEFLFAHSLGISSEFVQKWGSISLYGTYSNYLHDFSLNRININSMANIRICKGLELSLYFGYTILHNQIALTKGNATPEELLLQQRELKTDYSYYGNIGLTYTFGNLYNNVVNPRFGN